MRNILVQTTIEENPDDWNVGRFSRLVALLSGLRDSAGQLAFRVTARNRVGRRHPDPVLSRLHESDFDQLWLIAVDEGNGLTPEDCAGVSRFRSLGGGLMLTRDHMDLGCSILRLSGVGAAH